MADVPRIKAKKNFQWEQDNKSVRVTINMPDHKSMKNVQFFLSDLILKVTSKQKKTSQIIDFSHEVDYLSPENKFTLIDGKIIATIKKKDIGQQWEGLVVEDLAREEILERRKGSEARYSSNIKEAEEVKDKLRTQYDRLATKRVMEFEEVQNKNLENKKKIEKEEALNQVFRNVNENTGKIEYEEKKWVDKGQKALQSIEEEEKRQRKMREEKKKKEREAKIMGNIQ